MNYGMPFGGGPPGGGSPGGTSDRRQRLIHALLGTNKQGATPMFGGFGRGAAGGFDLPSAALPALSFNPFFAQSQSHVPNLAPPSQAGGGSLPPQAGGGSLPPQAGGGQTGYDSVPGGSTYDPNQGSYSPPADFAASQMFPAGQPSPFMPPLGGQYIDPFLAFGYQQPYSPGGPMKAV